MHWNYKSNAGATCSGTEELLALVQKKNCLFPGQNDTRQGRRGTGFDNDYPISPVATGKGKVEIEQRMATKDKKNALLRRATFPGLGYQTEPSPETNWYKVWK